MQDHQFDISVVLNVHNEAKYLRRTTRSLEQAARFARATGISVELVIVADSAPEHTRLWVENFESDAFDAVAKDFIHQGSLGLARNHGAHLSRGNCIRFCDGDDLIGYNTLTECHKLISNSPDRTIVYPEYLCAFGASNHVYKMYDMSRVSTLGFISYHPYIANIFARRDDIISIGYQDARLGGLIAYEDWHFVAEAIAQGFSLRIAPNTVLFYRKRPDSLLTQASATSMRIIDECSLFEPATYLKACENDKFLDSDAESRPTASELRDEYLSNRQVQELVIASNQWDPAIDVHQLASCHAFSNMEGDLELGRAYYRACERVGSDRFGQVAVFPFISRGGGEKYILMIIRALSELRPDEKILVICGEDFNRPQEFGMLPDNCVVVDMATMGGQLNHAQRALLCLRLIQSSARGATVHFKDSPFTQKFVSMYGGLMRNNRLVFYRFCDQRVAWLNTWTIRGWDFEFMSSFGSCLDMIVTDNHAHAQFDTELLEHLKDKYRVIPAAADVAAPPAPFDRGFSRKLLWASRLDEQKRPDLLPKLAQALHEHMPEVVIEVFGAAALGAFDPAVFAPCPNLVYRGAFSGFESLPYAEYDGLVYTTAFDGLPNIVLEGMACGLTVVAPDVGGIREVVNDETGFLIPNRSDSTQLIMEYVAAIERLYDPATDLQAQRQNARRLIDEKRGWKAFAETVRSAFHFQ